LRWLATFLLLLTGCGRYSDFTLPPPDPGGPAGPFTWTPRPEPVLARSEAADVLNPSVVRFRDSYWNFYSEYDGKSWHTAAATSPDGVAWTKLGRVLSPPAGGYIAANGSALVVGEEIFYWYETGYPLRIALARSRDGRTWTSAGTVLDAGPYRSFDERAVADPYVILAGDFFYLYYLGQDRAARQQLGLARSPDGILWEKLRTNPIIEGDRLGEPAVWTSGKSWWMLFTVRAPDEQRYLELARSSDGVQWTRVPDFVIAGDQPWNSKVLADPSVERLPNSLRVWFGGGDVPSPDQNLHGQIGLGELR
jgi:sucrose-6-phosphate hydrolase SacC (GH32 family)